MSSISISRHLWRWAMFDLGVLALRLVLGAVFLGHGAQKAFGAFGGPGFDGATGFVGSLGFRPARFWAALAVGGELAAGFLFLLGLLTPLAGLLALATMAVAIAKVHGPKGFFIQNGGHEYNLGLIVAARPGADLGPGALALDPVLARACGRALGCRVTAWVGRPRAFVSSSATP